jgi:hypothetical protein
MKSDNLTKACRSLDLFSKALEQAHTDSVKSGDGFAGDILSLIEDTLKMQAKLNLLARVASHEAAAGKGKSR